MAIKQGREYRALQDFSLVPRDESSKEYRVRGTAIVFNSPTVLWECDGVEYKEIIDRHDPHAFVIVSPTKETYGEGFIGDPRKL